MVGTVFLHLITSLYKRPTRKNLKLKNDLITWADIKNVLYSMEDLEDVVAMKVVDVRTEESLEDHQLVGSNITARVYFRRRLDLGSRLKKLNKEQVQELVEEENEPLKDWLNNYNYNLVSLEREKKKQQNLSNTGGRRRKNGIQQQKQQYSIFPKKAKQQEVEIQLRNEASIPNSLKLTDEDRKRIHHIDASLLTNSQMNAVPCSIGALNELSVYGAMREALNRNDNLMNVAGEEKKKINSHKHKENKQEKAKYGKQKQPKGKATSKSKKSTSRSGSISMSRGNGTSTSS